MKQIYQVIRKTIDILLHPAFLALLFTALIILLIPPVFQKYKVRLVDEKVFVSGDFYTYCDLNNDGESEEIWFIGKPQTHPTLIISEKGKVLDQWNFDGFFPSQKNYFCFDYNHDSIKEVFFLTVNNDSLFITGINPYRLNEQYFSKQYLDILHVYDHKYSCNIDFIDTPDVDEDGFSELIIMISTGFVKQPRNLYVVDIRKGTVIKSPESGSFIKWPQKADLNEDGHNEYFCSSYAFGNVKPEDSLDYPDSCAHLMAFDNNLKFLFAPMPFGQYKTLLEVTPFRSGEKYLIAALQVHQGTEDVKNKVFLFDQYGNIVREKSLYGIDNVFRSFLVSCKRDDFKDLYLVISDGHLVQLDSNLDIIYENEIPEISEKVRINLDIDMDGKKEHLFSSKYSDKLIIFRNDFSNPVTFEVNSEIELLENFSVIHKYKQKPVLYFQKGNHGYSLEYAKNPLNTFKYVIWMGIYLLIFLLMYLIQKVQSIRAEQKFEATKRISELQLKSIKGQTDPHFTLNLIESIGNLFYKKDSEKAAWVFGKYAKLLRSTLVSGDKIAVTLSQEIEYVKNYMDLEKFRYDSKFDYRIKIEENVSTDIEIPKMLIHTFVENSIKHGIKHKKGPGFIEITVSRNRKVVHINIYDDGIGRMEAKKYAGLSTGKGLKILDRMLALYHELKGKIISYEIDDLTTGGGKPGGTMIKISIPEKSKK